MGATVRSERGKVRDRNEDFVLWTAPKDSKILRNKGYLAIVADGMGGLEAGDVASRMAVKAINRYYYNSANRNPVKSITSAIQNAHKDVRKYAEKAQLLGKMGTTCVVVAIKAGECYLSHVGDSRCYLFRDHSLKRISRDQTVAAHLAEEGKINEWEIDGHPQSHILTQALGASERIQPAHATISCDKDFPTIFLCTDGVTNELSDDEIEAIFRSRKSREDIDMELRNKLMETPLRDNFSYMIITPEKTKSEPVRTNITRQQSL